MESTPGASPMPGSSLGRAGRPVPERFRSGARGGLPGQEWPEERTRCPGIIHSNWRRQAMKAVHHAAISRAMRFDMSRVLKRYADDYQTNLSEAETLERELKRY